MAITELTSDIRATSDRDNWGFVLQKTYVRCVVCGLRQKYVRCVLLVDLAIYVRCVVGGLSHVRQKCCWWT
jgi:hypothetical protein